MNTSIRILCVDDEPDFANMLTTRLEREDEEFEAESSRTPTEALETLKNETFDCVVSDHDMSGTDGIEFLELIREAGLDLPFILFTGDGSEEVASEAISAGVTDYVQKKAWSGQYEVLANRISGAVSQYRTDRQLERQSDLFAKAQSIARVGAWEFDVETGQSYVTDGVKQIHGLSVDAELTPAKSIEYFHPDDRETIREAFVRAQDGGESYDLTLRLVDENNTQRWVRTQGMPLIANGEVVKIRGTIQDVTEQTRREKQLERHNDRLEEFAHIVSHDLRSPLQVASGKLELAKQTGDEEAFNAVEQAHDRIEAIIDDVLTLARQGKELGETEFLQISDIAKQAWKTVDTEDIELCVDGGYEVEGDRDRVKRLFENLFRNAVEHAGTGTTVSVGAIDPMVTTTREESVATDGFYISDDGPGIPDDLKNEVFESGFTTNEDGTGFGLAIVDQIADAHGWNIDIKDSPAGGVRFEFIDQFHDV